LRRHRACVSLLHPPLNSLPTTAALVSIRVTTLGRLQVTRGDTVVAALPAQRLRSALLVYLAVTRESSRDRLLSLFWAEKPEHRARHALSQNVYELRGVLGEDWITITGEQVAVAGHVTIDLLAFTEAAERGDAQAALSLYRGGFLDGFVLSGAPGFDAWLENQRLRAQRLHRRVRREWIAKLVDQARMREAVQAARDWVMIDPLDDEGQHRLIELLASTGDRAGAMRQFDAYARHLEAEELEPLEETRQLVEDIRGGDVGALPQPAASMPAPASPPVHSVRVTPPPAPPAGPAAERRAPVVMPATSPAERRGLRRTLVACGTMLLLASAGFLSTRPRGLVQAMPAPQTVAVLYLQDHSPDGSARTLSWDLTERLTDALDDGLRGLNVLSRHAALPFRDSVIPADSIARRLDAQLLVAGSVTRADGLVRVSVELLDASGTVLSSETVTQAEGRYLELIDSLVHHVSGALRRRVGDHVEEQGRLAGAANAEAWEAVLRGRELMELGRQSAATPDRAHAILHQADSAFAAAERLDRRWAEPTLLRGRVAELRGAIQFGARRDTAGAEAWLETTVAHASRILALQPGNADALELRAEARHRQAGFTVLQREKARQYNRHAANDATRAAAVERNRARALALLASIRYEEGVYDHARFAAQEARRADAFLRNTAATLYVEALSEFELWHDAVAARRCDEGLRQFPGDRFAYCALHVMAWGDSTVPPRPDSAWAIARLGGDGHGRTQPVHEMLVAAVLVRAGRRDSAAAVLERALRPGNSAAVRWIEPVVRLSLGQQDLALQQMRGFLQQEVRTERVLASRPLAPMRPLLTPAERTGPAR